jgi:hypothetical protein
MRYAECGLGIAGDLRKWKDLGEHARRLHRERRSGGDDGDGTIWLDNPNVYAQIQELFEEPELLPPGVNSAGLLAGVRQAAKDAKFSTLQIEIQFGGFNGSAIQCIGGSKETEQEEEPAGRIRASENAILA